MKVLFIGETAGSSAEYVRDCLTELGHSVTHIDAKEKITSVKENYDVFILSDFPAAELNNANADSIKKQVVEGSRFIMLGGWASFNAKGNNYFNHPLSEILPVILSEKDDRMNVSQGLILYPDPDLQTQVFLNWNEPPVICGHNQALPKDKAQVLVWMKPVQTDGARIQLKKPIPLVIKGLYGKGTTIACLTDLAPHWCGGLVDWGSRRLALPHVEVGDMFLLFIQFLLEA